RPVRLRRTGDRVPRSPRPAPAPRLRGGCGRRAALTREEPSLAPLDAALDRARDEQGLRALVDAPSRGAKTRREGRGGQARRASKLPEDEVRERRRLRACRGEREAARAVVAEVHADGAEPREVKQMVLHGLALQTQRG